MEPHDDQPTIDTRVTALEEWRRTFWWVTAKACGRGLFLCMKHGVPIGAAAVGAVIAILTYLHKQ